VESILDWFWLVKRFNTGLELVLTKRSELSSGLVLTGIEYFRTRSKLDLNVQ